MFLSIVRDAVRPSFLCGALLLLAACGSDGDKLPELENLFPEVVLTDEGSLTVRGIAVGGEDPLESIVVEVGGTTVAGMLEADGRWTIFDIPLEPGENDLRVTVVGRSGDERTSALLTVRREPILSRPSGIAFDEQLAEAYVVDTFSQDLFRADVVDGGVDVLTAESGAPRLFSPSIERGALGGLFVESGSSVLKVDAATGRREVLAILLGLFPLEPFPASVDAGAFVLGRSAATPIDFGNVPGGLVFGLGGGIAAMAPDEAGNRVFALDRVGALYVAPATVASTPHSFVEFGVATSGISPVDAVYHPGSDTVLAINGRDGSILRYNVTTGLPMVLSEGSDGEPPAVEIDLE
ncbi:MAG: hypothetical protein AAGE43_21085, partial [Pseudomonadota bacterium]